MKTVQSVELNAEQKTSITLNKITFTDGYVAMEKAQKNGGSFFKQGEEVEFTITHPGREGKFDWIAFISSPTTDGFNFDGMKDLLIISQNALTNAVAYTCDKSLNPGGQPFGVDDVLNIARAFAEGTVENTKHLCEKYCIKN